MLGQRLHTYGLERPPFSRRTFRRLVVILAIASAGIIAIVYSGVLGSPGSNLLIRGAEGATLIAAVVGWLWSALRSKGRRRSWRLWMSASSASFLVGLGLWGWSQQIPGTDITEIVVSIFLLITALLALPGVILHAFEQELPGGTTPRTPRKQLVVVLDLLIMASSMLLFVLVTLQEPTTEPRSPEERPLLFSMLTQPLSYLLLLGTVVVLARFRPSVRDLPMLLFSMGVLFYLLSSTAFIHTVELPAISIPPKLESWFLFCPLLNFLASVAPTTGETVRPRPSNREIALLTLPYLPLAASIVLAAPPVLAGQPLPRIQGATFLALMAVVILRQLATLTENLRLLRSAEHAALHDPLTDLANRTLFLKELERALVSRASPLVLVFCDMDDFKEINDSYGHLTGDLVLRQTARRLESSVRAEDLVARLGGDEFGVLLRDPVEPLPDIERRLLAALQQPHLVNGTSRVASASVGVTSLPPDVSIADTDELMHLADSAMYNAKRHGKNTLEHMPEPREEPV